MRAATGLRNAAMFTRMHDAGLRTCEVIGLMETDIREDEVDGERVTCLHLRYILDPHRLSEGESWWTSWTRGGPELFGPAPPPRGARPGRPGRGLPGPQGE